TGTVARSAVPAVGAALAWLTRATRAPTQTGRQATAARAPEVLNAGLGRPTQPGWQRERASLLPLAVAAAARFLTLSLAVAVATETEAPHGRQAQSHPNDPRRRQERDRCPRQDRGQVGEVGRRPTESR